MRLRKPEWKSFYNLLVFLILFTSPFTAIRVWKIGITEIATLVLIMSVILQDFRFEIRRSADFPFSKFWMIALFSMSIGTVIYFVFIGAADGHMVLFIGDYIAYTCAFLLCFVLEVLIQNNLLDLGVILKRLFFLQSCFFLILFIISQSHSHIGPFVLRHWGFFKPLASNQHHSTISIMVLPFLGAWLFGRTRKVLEKLLIFALSGLDVFMGFNMDAGALYVGLSLGLFFLFILKLVHFFKDGRQKVLLMVVLATLAFLFILLFMGSIRHFLKVFMKEDGGGIRMFVWESNLDQVKLSPLFGLGPGGHTSPEIYGKPFDAHNTFLTILVQGGAVTLASFLILLKNLFLKMKKNPAFLAALATILSYFFSSDILRRMFVWTILIVIYYYVKGDSKPPIEDYHVSN